MLYLILVLLSLYVFFQLYLLWIDFKREQGVLEKLFIFARSFFNILFSIWFIIFVILGYLGSLGF
ncbi:hypothetical protein SAMN02910293_00625 [Streptococcus henryi]|jgi:hypothetical protein|uniref:Uncharacterized protein n=1 Tax=Streptococcus henryi TaxID=439219 RepID=A0A1G6AV78_9STRE|nr:hypothetical protein SAMN02910293_00625 [Streptococcus henryi]